MISALQFLETMYLPGFMSVTTIDFDGNIIWFNFNPVEPKVTVLSDKYMTPRGTHISISQSSYCVFETLLVNAGFCTIENFREKTKQARLKLAEFNQRFRREVKLDSILQGKLILTKLRPGKMPIIKIDFDLNERAITGDLTGVIAPKPVPQTNADILRI